MKVKELVEKLLDGKIDREAEVVMYGENEHKKGYVKFSGFSVDDNGDIELYIAVGDEWH